jgi:hypothetical protein
MGEAGRDREIRGLGATSPASSDPPLPRTCTRGLYRVQGDVSVWGCLAWCLGRQGTQAGVCLPPFLEADTRHRRAMAHQYRVREPHVSGSKDGSAALDRWSGGVAACG